MFGEILPKFMNHGIGKLTFLQVKKYSVS